MPDALPIQDVIRQAAKKHGVPEALALAVAEKESTFNPMAVGPPIPSMPGVRALGTFQLLPETAKGLGVDPNDPAQNIDGGVKYLRRLLDASNGDLNLTLKSYGGFKTADPTDYITDINGRMAKFAVPAAGPGAAGGPTSAAAAPPAVATPGRTIATGRASGAGPLATGQPAMSIEDVRKTEDVEGMFSPVGIAKGLVEPYDPRSAEGRQNLAGLTGEVLASRIPGGKLLGKFATPLVKTAGRILAPAVGAAVAAGTETAVEQAMTPRGLGDLITEEAPDSPARVALEQGAYNLGGQAMMWPVRRVGKLLLAGRVGRQAKAAVEQEVKTATTAGRQAVASVRDKVAEGVEAARIVEQANKDAVKANVSAKVAAATQKASAQVGEATSRASDRVLAARKSASARLAEQEMANVGLLSTATKAADDLLPGPPSVASTVAATRAVLDGPAKRALELAGKRVEEAAASGPAISIAQVQKTLQNLIKQKRPDAIFGQRTTPVSIGFGPRAAGQSSRAGAAAATMTGGPAPGEMTNLQKIIAEAMGVPESHPLPGVVGKIATIPTGEISFKDAHQIKRLLDEAVNWDRTAKKHLEQITKGVRTELRDALSVHEPYNVATAAYHNLVPIYRKGIGKRLSTALMNNSDSAARLLSARDPIQAQTLKDLLVTQSAAGGDAKAGQLAWDLVRGNFTYDHLIKGGADGLVDRVQTLIKDHPEFVKVIADDDAGKQVFQNLVNIGKAAEFSKQFGKALATTQSAAAKATGVAEIGAAKATGQADIEAAKQAGTSSIQQMRDAAAQTLSQQRQKSAQAIAQTKTTGRAEIRSVGERARAATEAAKATQSRLEASSVQRGSISDQLTDAARAVVLGPKTRLGTFSLMRLINGPRADDLIEWAAYSDQNTRRLTQALMGQLPDHAMSLLLRDLGAALAPDQSVQAPAPTRASAAGPVGR